MKTKQRSPESITNVDIVVYATAALGGAEKRVASEHIAAKCFALDPSRFSWRLAEYRKWPDKYIVKTALEDAKKEEYGFLVDGAYNLDPAKDGWRLTHHGASWVRQNGARLEQHFGSEVAAKTVTAKEQGRILRRIHEEPLYRHFTQHRELSGVSQYGFTDMLNCSPDASPDVVVLKFRRLFASAQLTGDDDAITFLRACAERFSALIPGWDSRGKQ
jgi:hypothetical protein